MNHDERSVRRFARGSRALGALQGLLLAGAVLATGLGVWVLGTAGDLGQISESARMSTMMDIGRSMRQDITRVVEPMIARTEKAARAPETVAALRGGSAPRLTAVCNNLVEDATEIDAIALFSPGGEILALNTVYASGAAIAPERILRVFGMDFGQRPIVQHCLNNNATEAALEFQTACDITPALFDSTGLSIAYSLPVFDPDTGERLGVVSARARFERITDALAGRSFGGAHSSVELVTDGGGYFSEAINGGQQAPPIPRADLAHLVAPLVRGETRYSIQRLPEHVACLFRLEGFSTLSGGGIQVLMLLDDGFMLQEARQSALLRAGGAWTGALTLAGLAGLVRLTRSLRGQRFRLRRLLHDALDAVIVLDDAGVVKVWNRQAQAVFGHPEHQTLGRTLEEIGGGGDALGLGAHAAAGTSGRRRLVEVDARRADGQDFRAELAVVPFPTDRGVWVGVFARDVSRQRQMESQLAQAQKLESIGQLAAGIAHEINTPAQYVSHNAEFLQQEFTAIVEVLDEYAAQLDPDAPPRSWSERAKEIRATLENIDYEFLREEIPKSVAQSIEGLDRISEIISAMKDFSHPGSGQKTPADLNQAIESTVTVCSSRWKGVAEMRLDLAPGLPAVPCLLGEFNQVILNLVVNAADAIESHRSGSEGLGLIEVSTRLAGEFVEVEVSDNGGGMPEAVRAKIFDPFFTTKEVGKGTGQGLAISRDVVVQKHGGELTCVSEPARGTTTFLIRLPLRAAADASSLPSEHPA